MPHTLICLGMSDQRLVILIANSVSGSAVHMDKNHAKGMIEENKVDRAHTHYG